MLNYMLHNNINYHLTTVLGRLHQSNRQKHENSQSDTHTHTRRLVCRPCCRHAFVIYLFTSNGILYFQQTEKKNSRAQPSRHPGSEFGVADEHIIYGWCVAGHKKRQSQTQRESNNINLAANRMRHNGDNGAPMRHIALQFDDECDASLTRPTIIYVIWYCLTLTHFDNVIDTFYRMICFIQYFNDTKAAPPSIFFPSILYWLTLHTFCAHLLHAKWKSIRTWNDSICNGRRVQLTEIFLRNCSSLNSIRWWQTKKKKTATETNSIMRMHSCTHVSLCESKTCTTMRCTAD